VVRAVRDMYQALATAVLLAATVFPLRLEGQMRATTAKHSGAN